MKINLKSEKIRKRWTQRKIAQQLNVSHITVNRWVRGTNFPNPKNLKKLSEILEVPVRDLIEDDYPQEAKK